MDGEQDLTANTAAVEDLDFSANPWFQLAAPNATAPFAGLDVTLEDLRLEGSFAPDGSHIGGIRAEANVDTRSMAALLDPDDPCALCNTAASLGATCTACRDGADFCLAFVVDQMTSEAQEDVEIVEITDGSALCATVSAGTPLAWLGLVLLAHRRRRAAG